MQNIIGYSSSGACGPCVRNFEIKFSFFACSRDVEIGELAELGPFGVLLFIFGFVFVNGLVSALFLLFTYYFLNPGPVFARVVSPSL